MYEKVTLADWEINGLTCADWDICINCVKVPPLAGTVPYAPKNPIPKFADAGGVVIVTIYVPGGIVTKSVTVVP